MSLFALELARSAELRLSEVLLLPRIMLVGALGFLTALRSALPRYVCHFPPFWLG